MFRIAFCCQILVLFFTSGIANSSIKRQCRAGVCDDRPMCPQSPCRCLYPSKVDCALYYQCVQGKPLQYRCSPGLLFNEDTLTCDYDFNVNCSIGKTTRKIESSTGAITITTSKISEIPVIINNDTTSDNSHRSIEPLTKTSIDTSEIYSTKIYQSTTSNEIHPTETTVSKFPDLPTKTTKTTLTEMQSESYSKPASEEDMTTTNSSLKPTKISILSTYSSFDILLNTTYSKSSDLLTKITNPSFTPRENTKYTSTTKAKEITSPVSEESEAPDPNKSTLTVKESEEPEENIFTSTAKESEKPEVTSFSFTTKDIAVSETAISRSTTKQKEEPETTNLPLTTKEIEEPETTSLPLTTKTIGEPETPNLPLTTKGTEEPETTNFPLTSKKIEKPETTIFKSTVKENKELETTRLTSVAKQSEEFETSSFRSTITTTSKPTVIIGSTGGTEHPLPTEEIQPDVTNDFQNRNWTCPFRFGLFPDESDCNKFYHCSHWKPYRKACPSNLHFNPALKVCDWPESAGCGQESTTSVSIETSATREPETSSNISCNCTFCMLPVPGDCSVYMMCTNNSAKVIVCGRGLYFNTMAQTCDLEDNLPCENNVQCPESSGRFPYPHSCVHYMDCNNFEITVKICPEGMIFDKDKAECLSGESCEDKFVTSTDSTNNKNSKSFTMDLTQSSTDYVSGSTSSSKTEKINSINDTTIMGTETTFTSKATPITEKNIATDKSNTTSAKINSTVYITTHTATTDFKFTSESVTKNEELFSTQHSDGESEFITITMQTDEGGVTRKDYSTVIPSINPKSETTTDADSVMTEKYVVSSKITSIATTFSNENSAKPEITSSPSKISDETLNITEIFSNIPDEISSTRETASQSTNVMDESATDIKTISSRTTVQDIISTETISQSETMPEREVSTDTDSTLSSVVSNETEVIFTYVSTEMGTTPSPETKINTEDISTISTADTFSETEAIRDLSTTMFNKETTNSVSNLSNETINEEESYSTLPEITTVKGISSNDTTEFKCPNRFGLYPDAKNCSKFYHCSHWIAYHKTCPSKLHFSSVLLVCDWPYKAGCISTRSTTTAEQNESTPFQPTTTGAFCPCDSCELPIPDDCNSYILCTDKSAMLISCGSGLNFNVKTGTCDWENNVLCETNIECPGPTGRFPYPRSCYHFMECNNTEMTVNKCPEGMAYDTSEERCSWTATCEDIETTYSIKYESTTGLETTTPFPHSAEIVKVASTKDTFITYTDNESSKINSLSTSRTKSTVNHVPETSTKLIKETSETSFPFDPVTTSTKRDLSSSSISTTYGKTTSLEDLSTHQKTKRDDSEFSSTLPPFTNADFSLTSKSNENYTTKRFISTTVSLSSEFIPTSSNHDFASTPSTELSTAADSLNTETELPDSSKKETINPTTEVKISTKIRENSSTSTGTNSFETESLIPDATTESLADFAKASTKSLVTILSSTDGSSLLTESSTNTVSKITENYQNFTTANDLDVKISTPEADSNSSFFCPSRFGLFPDPENCFRFYHCSHWVALHKWCPSDLHFNPKLQVCDWPNQAGCGESPIMPTSEIIQPNEKDIIVNQTCDCECCFYPNKTDCSRYTLCLDGYLHKGQCAEGLLFNHLDSNCDIAERVTCPQTSPSCPSQNGIYPHPTLCAAFYRCVNGQSFLEYCSENEHFKTSERKCVDPCDANCDKTLSCNTPRPPSEISGSPICIARDGLYPSEDDCSSYYMCTEGRAYPIKCPEGLHFNVEYGVCEPPCDARCDLTVDCPSPIQFAYSKSFEILPLHCPRPNGLFPVAGECGAYKLCSKGRAHLLHCPPGFHYSSKDETCETPCSAQCDKSVDCTLLNSGKSKRNLVPSVHLPLLLLCKTLSNGTLPNSKNCSSFYKCSNGKVHLMLCPRGLHFDPEDKTCKNPCLAGCDPNIQCPSEIPTPEGKCSCENCYLQDPTDCSAYLFCSHGFLTKGYCPRGMLFDRSSNKCRNASEVTCEAIGDPAMCDEPSGNFSYPGNCKKFIQCRDSVAHVMDCEDELEFDPVIQECANPKRHCEQLGKDPVCEEISGYFAHPKNSSLFYHCENGFKYLKSCSSPLIYNAVDQVCDWPHNVQESRKKVLKTKDIKHEIIEYSSALSSHENLSESKNSNGMSCEVVPGILCPCACRVTTYDDCQSFYHCLRNGKACKKRCPEGLYFNRKRMVCDLPQNVKCRDFFFATLRRLKSQKSDQTLIKYPLETAHFSPDPEILL